MLKFELSKQLFQEVGEDEETDDIDIGEGGQPDNESSNNKESDKDLFAKLFDYDHHQVETIASGDSQASKTLSRTSLAQLEREITARAAAASPHTEAREAREAREASPRLYRSLSEPQMAEAGLGGVAAAASQTDISAVGEEKQDSGTRARRQLVPALRRGPLRRCHSIHWDTAEPGSNVRPGAAKSVTFLCDTEETESQRYV